MDIHKRAQQAELNEAYPGRSQVIETLLNLLFDSYTPSPPALHLHASSPTRAYALVDSVLSASWNIRRCILDPLQLPSTPLLLAALRTAFLRSAPSGAAGLDATLSLLKQATTVQNEEEEEEEEERFVVVIQRAERMRDCWEEQVQEAIWGLAELLGVIGRLTVVTISTLPIASFRTSRGAGAILGSGAPIVLSLAALRKQDALQLLALDFPNLLPPTSNTDAEHLSSSSNTPAEWCNLHLNYISLAYDTMASDVRDEEDLRLLVACLWWVFIVPVQQGEMQPMEIPRLLNRCAPFMRDALAVLHTRALSVQVWLSSAISRATALSTFSVASSAGATLNSGSSGRMTSSALAAQQTQIQQTQIHEQGAPSLPLMARYILLASFLASFNPARLDARYFLRDANVLVPGAVAAGTGAREGAKRKRGGALQKRPKKRTNTGRGKGKSEMERPRLMGAVASNGERLFAILQSLLLEAEGEAQGDGVRTRSEDWETRVRGTGMMAALNNLISLRLLVRLGAPTTLLTGSANALRCNITFETAFAVAKSVKFDLAEWLWDFEEGA